MWKDHEQLRDRIKAAMDAGVEPFIGMAEAVDSGDERLIEFAVDGVEKLWSL